jgi:hypothetical protein
MRQELSMFGGEERDFWGKSGNFRGEVWGFFRGEWEFLVAVESAGNFGENRRELMWCEKSCNVHAHL